MYVLMVVPNNFPNKDAGAVRDDAFAQIYRELGYEVRLVGKSRSSTGGEYNGTEYISIYKDIPGLRGQFKRFLFEHKDYRTVVDKWIEEYGVPSVIHINSIPEKAIDYLIKIAEKNSIPIVHDSVEWYSPCEFKLRKLDKAYILKERLNRKVIRKPVRVYAISEYLNDYYMNKGIKSIRVPVIMDVINSRNAKPSTTDRIRMIYAGDPAKKDYLYEIVLGVEGLSEKEKENIEFNIFGANVKDIKELIGKDSISPCIRIHGRVSRETVQKQLLESDFSLLLRPSKERYAMAGFPTKSVEAMAHGVAMICNLSSDLGMYLKNMNNAIIVDGCTADEMTKAIRNVLALNRYEIENIKENARRTAENYFDYRCWIEKIKRFLES